MPRRYYFLVVAQLFFFWSFSQRAVTGIYLNDLQKFAKQNNLTAVEYQYLFNKNIYPQSTFTVEQEKISSPTCVGNNVANIGFEQGNFNGWIIQGGFNNLLDPDSISIGQSVPVTTILTGGTEPLAGFSLVSPLGGTRIVKMNDNNPNGSATILKTKFRVTNQTQFLKTAFALIISTASHNCKLNPYFKVEIYNCNETTKLDEYFTLMQEFPCVGQPVLSTTLVPGHSSAAWRTHCFDLSNYLNNTITLKITMADCPLMGHYAYGYFDATFEQASPSTLSYNYSINSSNLTFNQGNAITCYTNGVNVNLPSGAANYSSYSATLTTFTTSAQSYSLSKTGLYFVLMDNAAHNCVQQQRFTAGITPTLVLAPVTPSACPGGQYSITVSGADSYYSSQYYTNATPTSVTTVTNVPTTYTFTGVNGGLCTSSSTLYVPIYSVAPLTITPITQTICVPGSATINALGANTYTWNNASNSSSIVVSPTVANTSYNVHGHDANGCHMAFVNCTVSAVTTNTTLNFGAVTYSICPGDSTYVTANGPSVLSYSWSTGSTVASTYLKPLSTSVFTVWGTTACGVLTNTVLITVKPVIATSLTITAPSVTCASTSFSVNCTGAMNYTFAGSNTVASTSGNAFIDLPFSATSFTVKAKHVPNCYYTTSVVPITLLQLPSLTITPAAQTVCAGQQVTVSGQGANTYVWKNYFQSTIGTGTAISFTPNPTTNSTYYLWGTDANGCVATKSFVAYAEPNSPSIIATQYTRCLNSPGPVIFSEVSLNTANNTYTWNSAVGSGTFADTPTITTTYTLQSYNAACGYSTAYLTVTVYPSYGPTITAAVTPTALCTGQTVTFTMSGANMYTSAFFNLTASSTVTGVINSTTTTCNIIGYDSYGCSSTNVVPLSVAAQPTVVSFSSQTVCPLTTHTLLAFGTAASYSWSTSQTGTVIMVTPSVNTTYTLYGFSANNACYNAKIKSFYCYPTPTVFVNPSSSPSICPGASLNLTANSVSNSANSYYWNNSVNSNNALVVSPSVQTTYTVVGKDVNNTNCVDTVLVTVGIYNLPGLSLTIQNPASCSGSTTISAIASPTGGVFTPSAYASSQFDPGVHPLIYSYQDPVTSCKNTIVQTFTVNPNPCVSIWPSMDTICLSQTATLTTSPPGGTLTGQYLAGNTFSPSVVNNYVFNYSYYDGNGCYGSSCEDIFVMICTTQKKEFATLNSLSVFPNPFKSSFIINNPQNEKINYRIMDINGRVIEENTIHETVNIDLGNKPDGLYFVRLQSNNLEQGYKTYKLIKDN
jgi:hypothetical protein